MALVLSDTGSAWGQKNFFGQETKEAANAAEELAAAAKAAAVNAAEKFAAASKSFEEMAAESAVAILCTQLYTAAASVFEKECKFPINTAAAAVFKKESATSNVPYGGVCQVYPCLCYPKEILKKEDEERNAPHYVAEPPTLFNVELRKMFVDWATKHGKKYGSLYEMRLRYKIWRNTKLRKEQLCSKSGRTFSMKLMTKNSDLTQIEYKPGNRGIVKPGALPLSFVKKRVLDQLGESRMEKEGKEFDKWAERHKRVYSSSEEREERRLAYLNNMSIIDMWEECSPGVWGFGIDLENMDQFPWEKDLLPPVECSRCRPRKQALQGRSCLLHAPQQG